MTSPAAENLASQPEAPSKKSRTFYSPILTILLVVIVYYASQLITSLVISFYPLLRGLSEAETLAWLKTPSAQFWLIMLIEGIALLLVWKLLQFKGLNFRSIGLKKPRWIDISYALAGFVVYFLLYVAIALGAQAIFPNINFNQRQEIGFETARELPQLIMVFLSLVVAPPITEEILTRGFLYTGIKSRWPMWLAVVITSLMFGAAHLQLGSGNPPLWVAAIDTFALSLVLIYLREKTDSLGAPILLHMLKNGLAFTLLFVFAVR